MTAVANSFQRIWSAKNRVLYLTGWGTSGSRPTSKATTPVRWVCERIPDLIGVFRRIAPAATVIACSFFR